MFSGKKKNPTPTGENKEQMILGLRKTLVTFSIALWILTDCEVDLKVGGPS